MAASRLLQRDAGSVDTWRSIESTDFYAGMKQVAASMLLQRQAAAAAAMFLSQKIVRPNWLEGGEGRVRGSWGDMLDSSLS